MRSNSQALIGRTYCTPEMTVQERLAHVGWTVTAAGCWEWNGGKHVSGYGVLNIHGRSAYAHRESLQLALGRELALGMFACHRCDNPPCMNPDHLFEGSIRANNADMNSKGRASGGNVGGRARTPREVFDKIPKLRAGGKSVPQIAALLGISASYVYSLLSGSKATPTNYAKGQK